MDRRLNQTPELVPELVIATDPQRVFDEAAGRGLLVYDPPTALNYIYHWLYIGHDHRGNIWFQHIEQARHLVMPPSAPLDTPPHQPTSAAIIPFPMPHKQGRSPKGNS